jgi:hypothetical protein
MTGRCSGIWVWVLREGGLVGGGRGAVALAYRGRFFFFMGLLAWAVYRFVNSL